MRTTFAFTYVTLQRGMTSRVTSPQIPHSPLQRLQIAIHNNNLTSIHKLYEQVTFKFRSAVNTQLGHVRRAILTEQELINLIDILASSGRPNDLALLDKVFQDLRALFHIEPQDMGKVHEVTIRGLIRCGNIQTTYLWLMNSQRKTQRILGQHVSMKCWLLFLEHCLETGNVGMIRQSLKTMQKSGCRPTNEILKVLIRALFASPSNVNIRNFTSAFEDARREGLYFDPSTSALIYNGFSKLGRTRRALQVQEIYRATVLPLHRSDRGESHSELREMAAREGTRAAVLLCKALQNNGFLPNNRTLVAVLQDSTSPADLQYAEHELGVTSNAVHWSILITNAVRTGNLSGALAIYNQSRERQILPDVVMVQPIINALCFPPLARPSEAAIDRALDIYQDLLKSASHGDVQSPQAQAMTVAPLPPPSCAPTMRGPNSNLYSILLRTLASCSNTEKYFPKALALLDDMNSRQIDMASNSASVTAMTILLLRASSSYAQALEAFKHVSKSQLGRAIDGKGYTAILNAYCKLAFDRDGILPSLKHYFEIVKAIREAGHNFTAEVYTIILHRLANGAKRMTQAEQILSIRRVHQSLVLDTSFSPDVALWNQLMDCYQRAGFFSDARSIWDMLFVSGKYDNVSVSIILDACSFAGEWRMATLIFSRLFDSGFPLSVRNWNGWIESMCRLGRLEQAVHLVCTVMGQTNSDVAPDVESVRILVKFAKGSKQIAEVRSRIKQYLPDLWTTLPLDVKLY